MPASPVTTPSLVRDDLYVRNMAVLFRSDVRLAQLIDEHPGDDNIVVELSRKGPPTLAVRTGEGQRPVQVHSRIDPEDEARRFAESVEVGEDFCYIVGGFGLGHHLKALKRRLKGDAFMVVIEPNIGLLKAAMETVDLSELLADNKCIILTSADKGEVQTRLEPHNTLMMMGSQFVAHPPSDRVAGGFHAEMRKLIADHMTMCRMSLMTLVANARITCKNIAFNLPTYMSTPPIDVLRDRFAGYPAIVVSAGPSLRKNIDLLAELKGRAVIIAVQTTYKTLLDRGIVPDFVTSLDYHEMSKRFFENIDDFGGAHLVAEPKVTWHVVDTFRGPVSLLDNGFARLLLGEALAGRGGLKAGATVAHLAFYLAVHMGCEPIVLTGQDLGYTDNVYYAPGVAMHETWRPELNRFCTMEMKEWERIVRSRRILIRTKDIHGRDIYTDEQLFTYLQQFEGDFASVRRKVIDATEGGVRKANTEIMTLRAAAEGFCAREIPAEKFAYLKQHNWQDHSRLPAARRQLADRMAEADAMADLCRSAIDILKELLTLLDRPDKFNRRIADVDAIRVKIRSMERTYQVVSSLSQHAELQRFSADRRMGLTELDRTDRARKQLERDIRFVEAILEGTSELQEILRETLERFDAVMNAG